jgi:hypothetical protein
MKLRKITLYWGRFELIAEAEVELNYEYEINMEKRGCRIWGHVRIVSLNKIISDIRTILQAVSNP